MASPTYATIVVELTQQMDSLTQSFTANGYQALSSALAKPLASACVLYIILKGYAISRGLIKTPIAEFTKGMVRIGLIYLLAMNWHFFSSYVVDLFVKSASELGAVMMQIKGAALPTFSARGVNGGLQAALNEVIRVGNWTWAKATFKHWGPIFTALMIYFSGLVVIGLALFELMVAKLMLSLCLSTAPLFIGFTLFEQTRAFFDKWLGTLAGFSLLLVMVSTVVGLCLHLIHWTVGGHVASHAANISAVDWVPIFLVACLSVMALLEVTDIAKSIGGACSTSSGSAMVGGFMRGASQSGSSVKSLAKKGLSAMMPIASALSGRAKGGNLPGQSNMAGIRQQMRGES